MKIRIIIALLIIAMVLLYAYDKLSSKHLSDEAIVTALTAYQKANSKIIVYSMPGYPTTYRALETLKIYGFDSELIPVRSLEEMKTIPHLLQDMTTVPIFRLPFDELVSTDAFFSAIAKLPVVDFHAGKVHPYIIVYGVANCIYTSRAKEDLDKLGVPYEYIDMNSDAPRYMGEVEARLQASGYQENNYQTPIVEVNGYMRPRMDIDTVMEKYNSP
jgi:glutaredoxin